jgi:hypothetical protein
MTYSHKQRLKPKLLSLLLIALFGIVLLTGCDIVDSALGRDDDDNNNEMIHPVLLNGSWGYISTSGNIVMDPQFDLARDESGKMAAVREGTLWGYIQTSPAKLSIEPQFTSAGDFFDGLAPVQLPGQLYGFIDESGNFVIEAQYDFAQPISEGKAAVRIDGLWGFINSDGNTIVEPKYSDARPFSDGLAAVETFDGWVYIDESGNEIINPTFQISSAGEFVDGLAPIETSDGWGFINKSGSPVITPSFQDAGRFSQGLAWYRDGDYVGFIDKNGEIYIEPQFNEVKSFSENMAAVQMGNDWFYINKNSKLLSIAEPHEEADSFKNGIARVRIGNDDDIRYGYINTKGEYIWYPTQ